MENTNMKFCQSCAMPLTQEAQLGTEQDGSRSADYCSYCYQNGQFAGDMSMAEMIDFCVPLTAKNMNRPEAEVRADMQRYFPQLKRWAK